MASERSYVVKEMFGPTLQGEGAHAGRACVFLRFTGCNLACTWCDTDFSSHGAERLSAEEIASRLAALDEHGSRLVIVTGGEPTMQWDAALSAVVRGAGFTVHMESNGTRPLAGAVDWLTVSPKPQFHEAGEELLGCRALPVSECKLVVDDTVTDDQLLAHEARYPGAAWFVQPCMDADYERHLARTLDMIRRRPAWRLSLQLHKIVGLP